MRREILRALEIDHVGNATGSERLSSRYAVTDLAVAAIGGVGGAVIALLEALGLTKERPQLRVDRRLSSLWFVRSIYPIDWELPPIWDAIAGDYETGDGWVRLHTNLPHHRKAALEVLGCHPVRADVAAVVKNWEATRLEESVVRVGGVAAAMRSRAAWRAHKQGKAVADEPLIAWTPRRKGRVKAWSATREWPLSGLRVLDLTRVLAGPVATRTLAGFGADVLRIDPIDWEEANIVPDITLGKRCARLNLNKQNDRTVFEKLLSEADILIHGYRPGALQGLGYGREARSRLAANLIEIKLNAYGWTGPWSGRRGFDSLVQMSCGIAEEGMQWAQQTRPTPLPVQALDHAAGYLMAAAALRALAGAVNGEGIRSARLSLARTAETLAAHQQDAPGVTTLNPTHADFSQIVEQTPWGAAHRLKPPLTVGGTHMQWASPACALGSSSAMWL